MKGTNIKVRHKQVEVCIYQIQSHIPNATIVGPQVWCGVVWCGVVWCGVVWCGVVCLDVESGVGGIEPIGRKEREKEGNGEVDQ